MSNGGYLDIADNIEEKIATGIWAVNDKLPATRALAQDYDVTPLTMQRALTRLVEKGLIRRTPRQGSFVCNSPMATTIGLLLGKTMSNLPSPFYMALMDEFQKQAGDFGFTTAEYVVFDHASIYNSMSAFEKDSASGKLRCVVPVYFNDLASRWLDQHPNIPFVTAPRINYEKIVYLGLCQLIEKGYESFLVLSALREPEMTDFGRDLGRMQASGIRKACQKYGVSTEQVQLAYAADDEAAAYKTVKSHVSSDGYVGNVGNNKLGIAVLNDLSVRGVLMALLEAGLRIGHDVGIVCHQNEGLEIFSPVELTQIKIRPADLVQMTLRYIKQNLLRLKPGVNHIENELVEPIFVEGKSV